MKKKLLTLFLSTFYISAFTFGGGYVIVSLMKDKFVDDLGWMDEEEMLDLVAIAQSSPGAMAINIAILIGYKIAGVIGMITTVVATALPPLIIISTIAYFYDAFISNQYIALFIRSMQASVCAIIFMAVYDLSKKIFTKKAPQYLVISIMALAIKLIFSINVMYIIGLTIALSIIKYFYDNSKKEAGV